MRSSSHFYSSKWKVTLLTTVPKVLDWGRPVTHLNLIQCLGILHGEENNIVISKIYYFSTLLMIIRCDDCTYSILLSSVSFFLFAHKLFMIFILFNKSSQYIQLLFYLGFLLFISLYLLLSFLIQGLCNINFTYFIGILTSPMSAIVDHLFVKFIQNLIRFQITKLSMNILFVFPIAIHSSGFYFGCLFIIFNKILAGDMSE